MIAATSHTAELVPAMSTDDVLTRALATFVRVPPAGDPPPVFWAGHDQTPQDLAERYGFTESGYTDSFRRPVALLAPFFIQRFPVTNALFSRFIDERAGAGRPYITVAEQRGRAWVLDGKIWRDVKEARWDRLPNRDAGSDGWLRQPVTCVTWHDALAFAHWLDEFVPEGKARGYVVRLPCEAEWEFACRAGTASSFWWGDLLDDEHAVHRCGSFPDRSGPEPVEINGRAGCGRWNPWGLCDLSGNVWEWCHDIYDPNRSMDRALRGGSWGSSSCPARMLSFFRGHMPSDDVGDRNGFRLVIAAPVNETLVSG